MSVIKNKLKTIIADLEQVVNSIEDVVIVEEPPVVIPEQTPNPVGIHTVNEPLVFGVVNVPSGVKEIHFSKALSIKVIISDSDLLVIKNISGNSMDLIGTTEPNGFVSNKWMNAGDETRVYKTGNMWSLINDVSIPEPEVPVEEEPTPTPEPEVPVEEIPTPTPTPTPTLPSDNPNTYTNTSFFDSVSEPFNEQPDLDFGNLPYENFGELYGYDNSAFRTMLHETQSNPRHFYLKGSFTINEDILLPKNIKFSFDYNAHIKILAGLTRFESRIEADQYSHIFSEEGGTLELYPTSCKEVSFGWFGADTNKVDNFEEFTLAIKCSHLIGSFFIPSTTWTKPYRISKTVHFVSYNRPNQAVYVGWKIRGAGVGAGSHQDSATSKVKYTGKSGACFSIRGSRFLTYIRDFELEGMNSKPREIIDSMIMNKVEYWNPANWLNEGVESTRFSPYAGIAFDWVENNEHSVPWSAQVQGSGLLITDFAVPVSISGSEGYQADTIDFNKCKFLGYVYGVSVGQDQARACNFTNMWMDKGYAFYTNRKYGKRNGSLFNVIGGQYTTTFKAFDIAGQFAGNSFINGAYFEHIGVIGTLGSTGVNSNAILFQGCDFKIDDGGYTKDIESHWAAPYNCIDGGSNVTFQSCSFRKTNKWMSMWTNYNGRFNFNGCAFEDINELLVDGFSAIERQFRLAVDNCTWHNSLIDLNTIPNVGKGDKKYVRWAIPAYLQQRNDEGGMSGTTEVTTYLTEPFKLTEFWAMNPLIVDADKTFTVECPFAEYMVEGDFVTGRTRADECGEMSLNFGQLDPPCLQVVKVDGTKITYMKLAPEVDMTLEGNRWGQPWTLNKCWISGAYDIESRMREGDWFQSDSGFNRWIDGKPVVEIVGKIKGR